MKMVLVSGIYRPEIGGPATYIPSLAENLLSRNYNVEVVTLKDSSAVKQNEPWPVNYINRDQFLFIRFLKTVLLIFKKTKGADVHASWVEDIGDKKILLGIPTLSSLKSL